MNIKMERIKKVTNFFSAIILATVSYQNTCLVLFRLIITYFVSLLVLQEALRALAIRSLPATCWFASCHRKLHMMSWLGQNLEEHQKD